MSAEHLSPTVRPGHRHTGVVLRLPEPVGRELQDWRASFGEAPAGLAVPHITVMISPLERAWSVTEERVRGALAAHGPFHVEINGTGTFRPVTPVVHLRIGRGHHECLALHRSLHAHGLVSASPFDYHPHVTLAHGADDAVLDRAQHMLRTYRAGFLADRVHLYEGDEHGVWHERSSIPLGQPAADQHVRH